MKSRRSNKMKFVVAGVAALVIGLGAMVFYVVQSVPGGIGAVGSAHLHADFAVYVNGEQFDFNQQEYMGRAEYVHIEPGLGQGKVIHVHATGVQLQHFFETLPDFDLTESCLTLDGEEYCNQGGQTLKVFVNGQPRSDFASYEIQSKDRILVTYGDETQQEISQQIQSVTDFSTQMDP